MNEPLERMIRLMNGAVVGLINIGNPGEYEFTIRQLTEVVKDKINLKLELIYQRLIISSKCSPVYRLHGVSLNPREDWLQ